MCKYVHDAWISLRVYMSVLALYGEANALYWKSIERQNSKIRSSNKKKAFWILECQNIWSDKRFREGNFLSFKEFFSDWVGLYWKMENLWLTKENKNREENLKPFFWKYGDIYIWS